MAFAVLKTSFYKVTLTLHIEQSMGTCPGGRIADAVFHLTVRLTAYDEMPAVRLL
jgi:hypothetical protein